MKGLILHEYYCTRKQIVLFIRALLIVFALCLLLLVGLVHGNLKELIATDDSALTAINGAFDVVLPLFGGLSVLFFMGEKLVNDRKSGWNKYLSSLPVSDKVRVGANYIIAIFVMVGAVALITGFLFVCRTVASDSGNLCLSSLKLPFVVFCISATLSFVYTAVEYVLSDKKKIAILGAALYAVMVTALILWLMTEPSEEERQTQLAWLTDLFTEYYWLMPIILVIIIALSYAVSYIAVKRGREKMC
jgi:hypothetical protein